MTTSIRPSPPIALALPDGAGLADLRAENLDAGDPGRAPKLVVVNDATTADAALRRTARGELLLYRGDYRNARQLLSAMRRRLERTRVAPNATPLALFHDERARRGKAHAALARLLVLVQPDGAVAAKNAPHVGAAVEAAWGATAGKRQRPVLIPLVELGGMIGAHEWEKKGVVVPGLALPILPTYGVFGPTRLEPAKLAARIPDVAGKTFIDVGTGTGLLSLLLLARGAAAGTATDLDPRAVACATANAARLGFGGKLQILERDLFPEGAADLVVANPPWIPGVAHSRLEAAIYDPDEHFVRGFLAGLAAHLRPQGRGYLILSDFAERVGLRAEDHLAKLAGEGGLSLTEVAAEGAVHPKAKDEGDRLHAIRSRERVRLLELTPASPYRPS